MPSEAFLGLGEGLAFSQIGHWGCPCILKSAVMTVGKVTVPGRAFGTGTWPVCDGRWEGRPGTWDGGDTELGNFHAAASSRVLGKPSPRGAGP